MTSLQRRESGRAHPQLVALDGHLAHELLGLDVPLLILPAVSFVVPLTTVAHRKAPRRRKAWNPHFTAVRSMPRLMSLLPMTSMTERPRNRPARSPSGCRRLSRRSRRPSPLQIVALGELLSGLLEGVVHLLHIHRGDDIEAGFFSHGLIAFLDGPARPRCRRVPSPESDASPLPRCRRNRLWSRRSRNLS